MTERPATTAAERIAAELRKEIIVRFADGDHLGSAEGLAERFEVSVPTVRQALRILEAEGLVSVRRGNSGGFFASTPMAQVVSRSASALLQRQNIQLHDLLSCAQLFGPELATLAAANPDVAAREAVADYIEQMWSGHDPTDFGVLLQVMSGLGPRLGALCANPALALFGAVLTDLVFGVQAQYLPLVPPELLDKLTARVAEGHLLLARGLRDGDIPTARQAQHLINTSFTFDPTFPGIGG